MASSRSLRRDLQNVLVLIAFSFYVLLFRSPSGTQIQRWKGVGGRRPAPAQAACGAPGVDSPTREIFFLETSGEPCLTARQVCSVESAARANPDLTVRLHQHDKQAAGGPLAPASASAAARRSSLPGQKRLCALNGQVLGRLANVEVVREDLAQHLRDTPLWKVYAQGRLNDSRHPLTHWSDAVRAAILWRRGGAYLDLDVTVLQPLHCLRNTLGTVERIADWVENGVMIFDAGHAYLHFLMKYMTFAFKADEYISLGPATVTDAVKYFCDVQVFRTSHLYTCKRNHTLTLQPYTAFYAIANERQELFYDEHWDQSTLDQLKDSYLTHIYDAGNGRVVTAGSFYAHLSQEFCPMTYAAALRHHGQF